MKDSDKTERFLAMARVGFEPSARDRERVRRSLGSRLAGVVGVGASVSVAAAATGAASAAGAGAGAGAGAVASGATVAAAGGAAAAGLGKLFLTSVLWSTLGATTLVVAVEAVWQGSNSSVVSRSVTEHAAPSRAAVGHTRSRATTATTSAPGKRPSVGPVSKLREPDATSSVTRQRATPGVANAPAPAANPLKAELELLKQARHASEVGDARGTLATLSQLDRGFPAGVLLQERAALRAMATCQAASATARASALSEFDRSYPASVYVSKVRASCTVSNESQSSALPDTHTNDAAEQIPQR